MLQCRRIVHTIACHGGDLILTLQHLDELLLVGWLSTAEDHVACFDELELFGFWFLKEFAALVCLNLVVTRLFKGREDVHISCDGNSRITGISSDHHYTDACLGTHLDAIGYLGSCRILYSDNTNES